MCIFFYIKIKKMLTILMAATCRNVENCVLLPLPLSGRHQTVNQLVRPPFLVLYSKCKLPICNGFWDIAILLLNIPLVLIIFIISFVISLVPSNIYCLTTEAIHFGTKRKSCFLVNIIPFSVFPPHEQN